MCDGLLDKKIKRMNRLFFFVERIFFSRYGTCSLPVYQISEEEKKALNDDL